LPKTPVYLPERTGVTWDPFSVFMGDLQELLPWWAELIGKSIARLERSRAATVHAGVISSAIRSGLGMRQRRSTMKTSAVIT
jgi:hypothetical protein